VACLSAVACRDNFPTVVPALDSFYYPVGLAVRQLPPTPSRPAGSSQLVVLSSNFDLRFDEREGGTVLVVDPDASSDTLSGGNLVVYPGGGFRMGSFGGEVAGGYNFDVWGELSAGLRWYTGDAELRTGSPLLPDYDFDAGEAFLRFTVDTLDDINFPRNGTYSGVGWLSSQQGLGADTTFDQVDAGINYAKSWDRDTINAVARVGWTVSGDVPIQSLYQLGGPFRLSGLDNNALSGQYLGFGRLTYFRRVNDFQLMPAYLGASLEAGNAWLDRSDVGFDDLVYGGNLFFGVDTPIGPLYLGGGYSHGGPGDGGQFAGFLLLGRALRY